MIKGGIKRRFWIVAAALGLTVALVITEIMIIRSVSRFEPEVEIMYAKTKIECDAVIDSGMIEMRKVGVNYLHRLSIRDARDAVGKSARLDIEQGEMILSSKLGEEDKKIEVVDRNKRLFSVAFNGDQANGWQISPDQYVDIIFVPGDVMKGGQQSRVLKNIRIAAVINENGRIYKGSDNTTAPKYISFELTEEQAGFLAGAKGEGRLELSIVPEK